jgi:hypothetical protein
MSWTAWHAFDEAVREDQIPSTGGIYRFRSRGEPGLLYIGEGGNRRRRGSSGRRPPSSGL